MRTTSLALSAALTCLLIACGRAGPSGPGPEEQELKALTADAAVQQFLDQNRNKLSGILGAKAVTESPLEVLKAGDFESKYVGRPVAWTGQISDATVEASSVSIMVGYTDGKNICHVFCQGGELGNETNRKAVGGGWVVFTGILEKRYDDILQVRDFVIVARRTLDGKTEEFWELAEQAASELK